MNQVPGKIKNATHRIAEILKQRGSPLAKQLESASDVRQLSPKIRESIMDELGDEFSEKGFQENGEPNTYGLEIENLTDVCNSAME